MLDHYWNGRPSYRRRRTEDDVIYRRRRRQRRHRPMRMPKEAERKDYRWTRNWPYFAGMMRIMIRRRRRSLRNDEEEEGRLRGHSSRTRRVAGAPYASCARIRESNPSSPTSTTWASLMTKTMPPGGWTVTTRSYAKEKRNLTTATKATKVTERNHPTAIGRIRGSDHRRTQRTRG